MSIDIFANFCQLLLYWLFIFFIYKLKYIPGWMALYLLILGTSPFWFNDFLFPSSYMPDQFRYLNVVQSIRSFEEINERSPTVLYAGWILSLIPVPFVLNLIGLAFINKFIFTFLFIWLYKRKYIMGMPLFFILLYPDLVLYTSLALRDCIIMTLMVIGTIFIIQKRFLFSLLFLFPLWFIKFQNFFLMLILWITYLFFMKERLVNNKHPLFSFSVLYIITICTFMLIAPTVLDDLEHYRKAMYIEDGNSIQDYVPIDNVSNLLSLGIKNSLYFVLKPFIFETSNNFQLIQSFTNMIIFIFLIFFTIQNYMIHKFKTLFWLSFFFLSMFIYGLVVANFGTAARYKFPFIFIYVVALSADIYRYKFIQYAQKTR